MQDVRMQEEMGIDPRIESEMNHAGSVVNRMNSDPEQTSERLNERFNLPGHEI